ncbi:hypothetical protein F5883DRAFT_441842 [Diaporthe sp. PMI_573]|nr:hypothetical protein F5883DRAFT_441842 [Diaporthaceae sp. PMI_573]
MFQRDTVFPGSSQWANTKRSTPTSEANVQVSAAQRSIPRPKTNPRIPRIDLPINFADPDGNRPAPVVDGSPWKHYRTAFGLELGAYVAVVCKIPAADRLFSMQSVSGLSQGEKIDMLRGLKHENLLLPEEIFTHENTSYVITEYAAISLDGLVLVRPDEAQLAAIAGQVLHGLSYLASNSLSHGSITSANILLTNKGVVKIGERCKYC